MNEKKRKEKVEKKKISMKKKFVAIRLGVQRINSR